MHLRWQFWSTLAILVLAIFYLMHVSHGEEIPLKKSFQEFPLEVGAWKGKEGGLDDRTVAILGVEDYMMRTYRNKRGYALSLYVGYYESQRKGDIIHSPKHCYPGSGWQRVENKIEEIAIPSSPHESIEVNRFLIRKGLEKQLVFYWYQERGRINTSEYWAKFYLILDAVTRNRTDGSLVRISATVKDSVEKTAKHEVEFIQLIFPLLKSFLPE